MRITIQCFYSCEGCKLKNVPCHVLARGAEDVRDWMDATVRQLSKDHRRRSPDCRANSLQELKIPMTGTDRIGGPAVQ